MKDKMEELKKLRHDRRLTQAQFSEWLEIPKRTYEKWESGESTPPIWVIKLIKFKCEQATQGEQIKIEDKLLYCNVKTASRLDGEYRTYYTKEEEADKEVKFYEKKMTGYTLKREIYKKI